MEKFGKLVLNIPHSAVLNGVFDEKIGGWEYNSKFINKVLLEHCDLFTDFLFSYKSDKVSSVIAPYSRFVVDTERLNNDPLEKIGQGIIYTEYDGFKRKALDEEVVEQLNSYRTTHLKRLLIELSKRRSGNDNLLIDCHSFSSSIAEDIDVCIGFNDDASQPDNETISHIVSLFERNGYKVGINNPFSNSVTPFYNGIGFCRYKSVMIELNKRTYMDEDSHTINDTSRAAPKMRNTLMELYDSLLA
jgi:N-formylglutamate amidohydrolase